MTNFVNQDELAARLQHVINDMRIKGRDESVHQQDLGEHASHSDANQDIKQYLPGSMQVPMAMFDNHDTKTEDEQPNPPFVHNSVPPHSGANMMSDDEVPNLKSNEDGQAPDLSA